MKARRRSLARVGGLALALVLAISGCGQLPTSGPVREGRTETPPSGAVQVGASRPSDGDTPAQIVRGFLRAGAAGLSTDTDFEVARSFLTPAASQAWTPLAEVVVTANDEQQTITEPDVSSPEERVTVPVGVVAVGDVDAQGIYTASTARTVSDLNYELIQVDGQWRIDAMPEGLILTEVTFALVFQGVELQFLTSDSATFVPDVRHVPVRNAASHAVELLLSGPADWLAPAVATRVPSGAMIDAGAGGVTVGESGTASVHLSAATAPAAQLDQFYAQVRQTLLGVSGVREIALWLGAAPYQPSAGATLPAPPASVPSTLVAISEGRLVQVTADGVRTFGGEADQGEDDGGEGATDEGGEGGATGEGGAAVEGGEGAEAPGLDSADALRNPAPAYAEEDGVAALRGNDLVVVSADGATTTTLATFTRPLAPSQDSSGWIWSGEQSGALTAVRADGSSVAVSAEYLAAGGVLQLRLSRDGARAVVVRTGDDGTTWVEAAAVERDDDGAPVSLTEGPLLARVATALDLAWLDSTSLALLSVAEVDATPTVVEIAVSGPRSVISALPQSASLTAANGTSQLVVGVADGRLLARESLRWEEVATEVSDPAFPG